jgi:hypothetical protein
MKNIVQSASDRGLDAVLVAILTLITTIISGEHTEGLLRSGLIIGMLVIYILYIVKAVEAVNLKAYKTSVYKREVYRSDVPEYAGETMTDLNHLKNSHKTNKGSGLYAHEVNYYRINNSTVHVYIIPLGYAE